MSTITSTGLGSGLDINTIVEAIVAAEEDPVTATITTATADATAKISAYGLLNSALSSFESSYADLAYSSTFNAATSSSSDSSILDAELGIGAATGSWEFEVTQRAQAQTLVSASGTFSEVSDTVGEGTLQFRFGTYSEDGSTFSVDADKAIETLEIDETNNTLEGMRDAINDGDYSVTASIVDDGSSYRLVLTNKETGEQNSVEITATDSNGDALDTDTGLGRFTYSADSKVLEETSTAQDAEIVMNGISITRDSNEISNVIEGVTILISGETETGKTVTLTIESDTSEVEEQITDFVENYNTLIEQMNELTLYDGDDSDDNGVLIGDSTIRGIRNMLRGVLNTLVDHTSGSVHSFADLGMLTQTDGTLELDTDKLEDALENDMSSIADFFIASGGASDSLISFESSNSSTEPGTYAIEVTQLATQGSLTGSDIAASEVTIDDDNDTFTLRLDGFLSEDIVLSQGTYSSLDDLATELQLQINSDANFIENGLSITVTNEDGKLSFVSNQYGSSSTLAFIDTENTFLDDLGLTGATVVTGIDVEGTIDGVTASGEGQYLLSTNGDSTGIQLLIDGGLLGSRGDVTFTEGMTSMLNTLLTGIIDSNISSSSSDVNSSQGTIDAKIDFFYKQITDLEDQQETLTYRMEKLEARLYTQYNAMDIAVANLESIMTYLDTALDSLPGYSND